MFAHKKKNYRHVVYIEDPIPNIVYIAIWMPACIVWLYYASSSTMWRFLEHFFCLGVSAPLKKEKEAPWCTYHRNQKELNLTGPPGAGILHSVHTLVGN